MPMRIALLGAGFTRNWGGWLASELVGELCGRIDDDSDVLQRLKKTRNFESVLGEIRQEANRSPIHQRRFERFQKAVLDTFDEMNQMLANQRFEFNVRHSDCWLVTFLSEFDAIFTLNQDLMLELHYMPGRTVEHKRKWRGAAFPGISLPENWAEVLPSDRLGQVLCEAATLDHDPREQPIYKLHGSVNWRTKDGSNIVVIGEGKEAAISGSSLLSSYMAEFSRCLSAGKTKLMVVGYSFSDQHLNALLAKASADAGLQTYLVNPSGLAVFDPPANALIKPANEVFNALTLTGILTRPFRDAFISDALSFNSLQRFLHNAR